MKRMAMRSTPLLRLAAGLALGTGLHAGAAEAILQDGQTLSEARGVWYAAAQGWYLQIDGDGIERWQDSAAGCYATPAGGSDRPLMGQLEYQLIRLQGDGDSASFQYLPGDHNTRFERVAELPGHCGEEDLSGERATFEVFAAIMEAHYAFFEARGVDWAARTRQARPRIRDGMGPAALRDVLADMLEGLGDSHTKLLGEIDGQPFRIQDGQGQTLPAVRSGMGESAWLQALVQQLRSQILDEGGHHVGNERIVWGTIGGDIGYLQLFTMGGFSDAPQHPVDAWAAAELAEFNALLDSILSQFSGLRGVIVDLSNNRGGYDAIARALAARFSDSAFDAYSVDTDRDARAEHHLRIAPADGPRYTGPVMLLTSDVTVSGGEIATLAFRALGHVTHAGARTRGSFSTPLAKPLPNGWYLELSSESYADHLGVVHEATGIEPSWQLPVYPAEDPVGGHARALIQLAAALRQQASRTP